MKNLKSLQRNLRSDVNEESHHVVQPQGIRWRSHTLFIVSTVIVGLFSETFLYGIVIPVLPFILQDRMGIAQDELQSHSSMLLAAYAGSSVIFCPITGALGDKLASRKLLFIAGLVILIVVRVGTMMTHEVSTDINSPPFFFSWVNQ
jgi:MFS family permease